MIQGRDQTILRILHENSEDHGSGKISQEIIDFSCYIKTTKKLIRYVVLSSGDFVLRALQAARYRLKCFSLRIVTNFLMHGRKALPFISTAERLLLKEVLLEEVLTEISIPSHIPIQKWATMGNNGHQSAVLHASLMPFL